MARENRQKSNDEKKQDAIQEAMQKQWPGMEDFRPDEIAWITQWNKAAGKYEANPYPLIGGRLRLLCEDHKGENDKYSIRPPDGDSGITEIVIKSSNQQGKIIEVPGYRVTRVAETKRGLYYGTKEGKADNVERLESMAVARALRFAGYGYGFTSAEEMREVAREEEKERRAEERASQGADRQDAHKQLDAIKKAYYALVTESKAFANDTEKHEWQKIVSGGRMSTTMWKTKADFRRAIEYLSWRNAVGKESDELLIYFMIKAKSIKGLQKAFLEIAGVAKLSEVTDIDSWKIQMASAHLFLSHKSEEAKQMGRALVRSHQHEGLFKTFLEVAAVTKLTGLDKESLDHWQERLKEAVERYNTEKKAEVDLESIIKEAEKMLV